MFKSFFSLFAVVLLLSGCSKDENAVANMLAGCDVVASRKVVGGDTVIVWHSERMDPDRKLRIPLSAFIDSLEIVTLEGRDERAFCGMGPIWISDNYILTSEGTRNAPSLLFRRDGSFVSMLGSYGEGPGEYRWLIASRQIDEENGRVYVHPQLNTNIMIYDLEGNFLGDIPLALTKAQLQMEFFVDQDGGSVDVIRLCNNYKNQLSTDTTVTIWRQTSEGRLTDSKLYPPFITTHRDMLSDMLSMETMFKDKNGITFLAHHRYPEVEGRTDTLYRYDYQAQKLIRLLTMEPPRPTTQQLVLPFSSYYLCRYWNEEDIPAENSCRSHYGILDPATLRGAECEIYNDLLGGIDLSMFDWQGSIFDQIYDNNYGFAWMYDPGDLLDKVETRLEKPDISEADRKILESLRERINPEGNNIILLGRPKEGIGF